ncbi:MAG: hypothetical protein GF383_12540 [Candidatus Lokiarchaeota archaeon]|nr:hypothetical protein [Candidatus Lokiarchaeota archaeon]MBD3341853.1 hypothetical protein [Candidatus Lokiarchaeota archaeon]
MLSISGWLVGITALWYVGFGCFFGFFLFYKGKRSDAYALAYMGLSIVFGSLLLLGPTTDFLHVLIIGRNIDNSNGIVGILSFTSGSLGILFALLASSEVLNPKLKKPILIIFSVLGVIWEVILYVDPLSSIKFTEPSTPGQDIIDSQLIIGSPLFYIEMIYLISLIIFNGFGFLLRAFKSSGILRNKFLIMSIGYILYIGGLFMESSVTNAYFLIFIRAMLTICFILWYIGLREASEQPDKKKKIKKEIKIEQGLFRITERPNYLSEEEVTYYKERKICLVCKGKVAGINYICPKCDTLYCMKCVELLTDRENACWVCNKPFDESKPSKPHDLIEEKVEEKKKYKVLKP